MDDKPFRISQDDHGKQRIADAQALADVRTLDEWAGDIQSRFWAVKTVNEQPACCLWALDVRELAVCVRVGSTPDEARAKAAAWVREQKAPQERCGNNGCRNLKAVGTAVCAQCAEDYATDPNQSAK